MVRYYHMANCKEELDTGCRALGVLLEPDEHLLSALEYPH